MQQKNLDSGQNLVKACWTSQFMLIVYKIHAVLEAFLDEGFQFNYRNTVITVYTINLDVCSNNVLCSFQLYQSIKFSFRSKAVVNNESPQHSAGKLYTFVNYGWRN